jgi:hypothetical protein
MQSIVDIIFYYLAREQINSNVNFDMITETITYTHPRKNTARFIQRRDKRYQLFSKHLKDYQLKGISRNESNKTSDGYYEFKKQPIRPLRPIRKMAIIRNRISDEYFSHFFPIPDPAIGIPYRGDRG